MSRILIVFLIGTLAVLSVVAVSEYAFGGKKPLPKDEPGGCGGKDSDHDGSPDGCDACPNLWNGILHPCPDPLNEFTLVAGPGSPGPMDPLANLNVINDSNYSYRVDLVASSSHAYCPTCDADIVVEAGDCSFSANCSETNNPNPGSYGGKFGGDGELAPCNDDVLTPGDNRLQYNPFHHCCDISKDVLFAAYLVITEYRYIGATVWRTFPDPAPVIQGWTSNDHVAEVGFAFSMEIDAGGDPALFTIPDLTVPGCSVGGRNEHYAQSAADFDGDGIPDACDCDDDNDGCLDGYDISAGVDTKLDCCAAPNNCDTGDTTITSCDGWFVPFGKYSNFPFNCRGYSSVPATCAPGTCGECVPNCDGAVCGDDGCNNPCPPGCGEGETCADGACVACQPDCAGRECGSDGCTGTCAPGCSPNASCDDGICGTCVPDCDGMVCGDNGCGGSCGSCDPPGVCSRGRCLSL